MIGAVIADLTSRVTAADGVETSDETVTVTVDAAGDVSTVIDRFAAITLRVVEHGRTGWAGGHAEAAPAIAAAALESARVGDPLDLILPASSPIPPVVTRSAPAAAATPADLRFLARALRDRLQRDGRRIESWAERSAGTVQIGNTRGVAVGYEVTIAGLGATVLDPATGIECRAHVA